MPYILAVEQLKTNKNDLLRWKNLFHPYFSLFADTNSTSMYEEKRDHDEAICTSACIYRAAGS